MQDDSLRPRRALRETDILEPAESSDHETAANLYARDLLIPPDHAQELATLTTPQAVQAFAERLGIAPGIVVGRLHHDGLLPWKTMAELKRVIDFSLLEQGQQAMWATWLTVTEAARLVIKDLFLDDKELPEARATVSEAASRGAFITNCRQGKQRRIEPVSLAAWRLRQRDRELDDQDRLAA